MSSASFDMKDYCKKRYEQAKAQGICVRCHKNKAVPGTATCMACKSRIAELQRKYRKEGYTPTPRPKPKPQKGPEPERRMLYSEDEIVTIYKRGNNKKEQIKEVLPQLTLLSQKEIKKILREHGCNIPNERRMK